MLDLRERTQTLSAIAGYFAFYGVGDNLLSGRGEPERLSGVPVSENFFDVLGVKPLLGRAFNAQESRVERTEGGDARARPLAAALRLGPKIVGTSLIINDEPAHRGRRAAGVVRFRDDLRARQPHFDLYFPFPLARADQSLGQHHGDDRPAEAGGVGGCRARRSPYARRPDHRGESRGATASRAT